MIGAPSKIKISSNQMTNQQNKKQKITKEDIEKRVALGNAAREIEKMKRGMPTSDSFSSPTTSTKNVPLQSLTQVGKSEEDIFKEVQDSLSVFLDKLGQYAFSFNEKQRYFPNSKIKYLVELLKAADMELEARYIMDVFKNRVKQLNGGKIPKIKEKTGLFGKVTERTMRTEEIAVKYKIEEDFPEGESSPLNVAGTQSSILNHLYQMFLQNDDIQNPLKKAPRKMLAKFLQAAGLINPSTNDPRERYFVACLLTPNKIQPQNVKDSEQLVKYQMILRKGIEWLDEKLAPKQEEASTPAEEQ